MEKLNELVEMAERADSVGNLIDAVNPHTILAIAEAFRALEQRAEAAEAYAKSLNYIIGLRESDLMAVEAKLAELVPDEAMSDENNTYEWVDGWNACRAAILRNIEQKK